MDRALGAWAIEFAFCDKYIKLTFHSSCRHFTKTVLVALVKGFGSESTLTAKEAKDIFREALGLGGNVYCQGTGGRGDVENNSFYTGIGLETSSSVPKLELPDIIIALKEARYLGWISASSEPVLEDITMRQRAKALFGSPYKDMISSLGAMIPIDGATIEKKDGENRLSQPVLYLYAEVRVEGSTPDPMIIKEYEIIGKYFLPSEKTEIRIPDYNNPDIIIEMESSGRGANVSLDMLSSGFHDEYYTNIQKEPFEKLLKGLFNA